MITNFFIPELNNHDVQELWFQQHGATCYTARATIDLLKDTLGDRLISRFGPVNWPPRSCDLTPLGYFLWGYVKSLVYADKPRTLGHLEDNIRHVIADIRPQMLEKVIENWTSRLDYIRASRGSLMPERECTIRYDQVLRHTSSVSCLETFRSIFAVTLPLVRSNSWGAHLSSQMIPDMFDWRQIWGSDRLRKGRNSAETVFKGRIEAFITGSPHTNTIVITADIQSGFVAKADLVPFRCSSVSSCAAPLQTETSMGGRQGFARNRHRDPKYPSARRLRMVREDTGAPNEGATYASMAADEAVGCTRAFLTMWRSCRRLVCRWHPEPALRVNDIFRGSTGPNASS
ncbi:uncharacterized protein TNCV_4256191 [Trichonephila clavipes]|nr:uncharacterized protein TNCV_4256191 [Trichonephila clavipes]